MSFVFELKAGNKTVHRIVFPLSQGRRDLRALGGTKVGVAVLDSRGLKIEFVPGAIEKLIQAAG